MSSQKLSVILEIEKILSNGWDEHFSFDSRQAESTGVVVLCWKSTGVKLPLTIEVSQKTFDNGSLNYREIRDQLKKLLPDTVIKQLCSDANYLLRNAGRRHLKDVQKDFKKWAERAATQIRNVFGHEAAEKFSKEIPLPQEFKRDSIQALQYLVEARVIQLQEI